MASLQVPTPADEPRPAGFEDCPARCRRNRGERADRTRADAEARRDGGRERLPAAGGCTHAGRAVSARATTRKTGVLLARPGASRPAVPAWRLVAVGTTSASRPV